jgi:hypothetical protein
VKLQLPKYLTLNAIVAQAQKFPFEGITMSELKNITTTSDNNVI